jgi:hypothetical protein
MERIELPYRVATLSFHVGATRYRNGHEARVTQRYFATKEEAVAFCGDPKKVKFAPGEAWKRREA